MSDESEAQRQARLDGPQIAFAAVLRELVRNAFPMSRFGPGVAIVYAATSRRLRARM